MDKQSEAFLYKYLNNASPTGFESSGQEIWLEYVKPFTDTYLTDTYGSVAAVVNPDAPYKVVIEAHADEISWFVNYISPEGYLYVRRNGGSDHQIAPSKRVNIFGDKGVVKGVFGWPAIHVRDNNKEQAPTLDNIFIDCGCESKEEVEKMGIHVGTVVTFDDELTKLNDRFWCGRALDNRIGGFMIAEVAKRLHAEGFRPDFGLYIVNAVQEEIGLRGAEMMARKLKPNVAVITDVCHDTGSPMYDKKSQGEFKAGNGPVLTVGPAVHNNLHKMLTGIADKHGIKFQRAAASRYTGTDTDAFAYSNEGVASALISIPLKYMHTTVEMAHIDDIEQAIGLYMQFIKTLEAGHDFRYIQ